MNKKFYPCSQCGFWIETSSDSNICPDCGNNSAGQTPLPPSSKHKILNPLHEDAEYQSSTDNGGSALFALIFEFIAVCILWTLHFFISDIVLYIIGLSLAPFLKVSLKHSFNSSTSDKNEKRKIKRYENPYPILRWLCLIVEFVLFFMAFLYLKKQNIGFSTFVFYCSMARILAILAKILLKKILQKIIFLVHDLIYYRPSPKPPKTESPKRVQSKPQKPLRVIEQTIEEKIKNLGKKLEEIKQNQEIVNSEMVSKGNRERTLKMLQKGFNAAYQTRSKYKVKFLEVSFYRLQNRYVYITQSEHSSPKLIDALFEKIPKLQSQNKDLQTQLANFKEEHQSVMHITKATEALFSDLETKISLLGTSLSQVKDFLILKRAYFSVHSISNFTNNPDTPNLNQDTLVSEILLDMKDLTEALNEIENEYCRFEAEEELINQYE